MSSWPRRALGSWPVLLVLGISLAGMFVFPGPSLAKPTILSGDEPHYLVMLSSLVEDQDLDLHNNHREAWAGGDQAGVAYRFLPLGPHLAYYTKDGDYLSSTDDVFRRTWTLPGEPALREGVDPAIRSQPWYSLHGYGLPMATAPLAWVLRGVLTPEQSALVFSAVLLALCYWLMRRIVGILDFRPFAKRWVPILATCGTPLWFYGHHYFTEILITAILLLVAMLALERKRPVVIGLAIGLGVVVKATVGVIALPVLAAAAWLRQWRWAGLICIAMAVGVGLQLYLQHRMFGSVFRSSIEFQVGNPLTALLGNLVGPRHGVLFFSPILLIAAIGLPHVARDRRLWLPLAMAAAYAVPNLLWSVWGGGYSYGSRLMVPVYPFLLLGLNGVEALTEHRRVVRVGIAAVAIFSIVIQATSHLRGPAAWGANPLTPFF